MTIQIHVYHRELVSKDSKPFTTDQLPSVGAALWQTCVRSIIISNKALPYDQCQAFEGRSAIQFLAQVVCGLRSPMLGETEVHGQFKKLIDENGLVLGFETLRTLMAVHFLARKVRAEHLSHLGCQSYGSYCRKKLTDSSRVLLIGSGHLTQEILPWIKKNRTGVTVLCRDLAKAKNQLVNSDDVEFVTFDSMPSAKNFDAVIVAAPVAAEIIQDQLMKAQASPKLILDLRAESLSDQISKTFNTISLHEIFDEIQANKQHSENQVLKASKLIEDSVENLEGVVGRQLSSIKVS